MKNEAIYFLIQDRNLYYNNKTVAKCIYYNSVKMTIEHLATRCGKLLDRDYKRRHNEIIKCIHLHLMNKYKLSKNKRLRLHKIEHVVENDNVRILCDMMIKTDRKIKDNKPDIIIFDKKLRKITIIEVGVTNRDILKQVEVNKYRKYQQLVNELGVMYKMETKIIPYVITWDGFVSIFHTRHIKELGLPATVRGYIQSVVLRTTADIIFSKNSVQ